jgi:hypothetical protein
MSKEIKYFTREEITKKFHSYTAKEKCHILLDALEWMSQYNGRGKLKCIALAMGYDNTEGDGDTFFKR